MLKKLGYILSVSGSIMAFHVGSGFSSGQEVLQFYTAFGPVKGLYMCMLAFAVFVVLTYTLLETGRTVKTQTQQQQYIYLAGGVTGRLFYWITPLFMSLVLFVTIAGGGAAMQTLFGAGPVWACLLTALPVLFTALMGLRWITALSGSIGPLIIAFALVLGFYGIVQGRNTELWTMLPHVCGNWVIAGISYASFGTITQIPFLLTVGAGLPNKKASVLTAVLGNGGYVLTGAILHLGLYRSLPQVLGEQLPTLRLARQLSGFAGWFYGIVLLFSIYTTAVPMLWSVCRTVHPHEKSLLYRGSAAVLILLACVCARLPFDRLLGVLYPYIGYVSAVFFAIMLLRRYWPHKFDGTTSEQRSARAV